MAEFGSETLVCERNVYQANVFRKLDLILMREDGLEYDENGCIPCIGACKKPVYQAGQTVTGYLLVRPTKKIIITGFSVTIGGRYETSWTEGTFHWGSNRVFFSENTKVIQDRPIALDARWYRFDFEYTLPRGLPPSVKEPEGKVTYYGYGSITRLDGSQIDTHDIHFTVKTHMDLDMLPSVFHEPAHRKRLKTYSAQTEENSEHELSAEFSDHGSVVIHDPHILATLCLSSRAFIVGQHMIADVTIENYLHSQITCTVNLEQVFTFEAHAAREYCGRGRPPLYLSQTRTKATRKPICKPNLAKLIPGAVEAYNCVFQVPDVPPTTPDRYLLTKAKVLKQREPLIRVKYYLTLSISSQEAQDDFMMPMEIKIGTCDSMTRDASTNASSAHAVTSDSSNTWDLPPESEEAPPGYEEPYNTTV